MTELESQTFETIFGVVHLCCHYDDGSKTWWTEAGNKRHRENGPAIMWKNGKKEWYLDGEELSESEFNKILAKKRIGRYLKM